MKNGYKILTTLTSTLNESESLINSILKEGKDNFSNNDDYINIAIGFINEIGDMLTNLDENIFILNRKLYDISTPILNYSRDLFNEHKFVNAYKLYDTLKIDIKNLKDFLNAIGESSNV